MKYKIEESARFRRELKTALKRGWDAEKLKAVVDILAAGKELPLKYHDHGLIGDYKGHRECHITADWLLIYRYVEDVLVLYLFRTGTYSDLF
ncbi:MAG: type II toxin-antitoxin system YafQ family toxin [Oscillospiraceae bacterium]|jgi:mRNA interferase YafQ|nr:type II toxin-antitoxin system YafQ family toxin [Oscillospiraceae bacterium]